MRRIYKYPIDIKQVDRATNTLSIALPVGAEILSFQVQRGIPCIWAAVSDIMRGKRIRTFHIAGTGHDIPDYDELKFIGTVQLYDGDILLHLFENVGAAREPNIEPGEIEA